MLNFLSITSFVGQQNDNELINLIPFLIWLSKKPDVRPVCDLYTEYSMSMTKKMGTEGTNTAFTYADLENDVDEFILTERRLDQPEVYYARAEEQQHNSNTRKMECVFLQEPTTPVSENKVSMTPELLKSIRNFNRNNDSSGKSLFFP